MEKVVIIEQQRGENVVGKRKFKLDGNDGIGDFKTVGVGNKKVKNDHGDSVVVEFSDMMITTSEHLFAISQNGLAAAKRQVDWAQ